MDIFIYNLMLFLEVHFGKQVHKAPARWWIDRDGGAFKEVCIINNFNTIVFATATKDVVRARNHNKPVYIWNRSEVGIKVDPDTGKVTMWTKQNTLKKGAKAQYQKCNYWTVLTKIKQFTTVVYSDDDWAGTEIKSAWTPLLDEFLAHHGVKTLDQLVVPAAEAFGITTENGIGANLNGRPSGVDRSPWMDFALGARTLEEFWLRLGRTVKLAKDEKRALVALIRHDYRYMAFARMATRISIPNIRDLTVPQPHERQTMFGRPQMVEPWGWVAPNSDSINKWMMGLRAVAPNRRLMFLQQWGPEAQDTLTMLSELRRAGEVVEPLNFRLIHDYHEWATITSRLLRTKLREIPEVTYKQYTPAIKVVGQKGDDVVQPVWEKRSVDGLEVFNTGIRVVVPSDTHVVEAWGISQHHCIGTYAGMAADGRTKLLGFKRGDEWVGHCSIDNRRCTQLLAKFNAQLEGKDKAAILKWMVSVNLIAEAKTGWG
jgi:hypothetical protein